jgi:asparagine synthase (glutamine-hydrolysing)
LGRDPNPVTNIDGLINVSFGDRMNVAERVCRVSNDARQRKQTPREAHCESIDSGLIPYTLELADKASAAFGLEARYPFFDRRLIEFCVALPANQKLKGGWTRSIMRRAMTGILPAAVQWRLGKANLSPNFRRGLLDLGKPTIEDIVINNPGVLDHYVNISALREAYERYSSRPTRGGRDELAVYNAVMLGWWLRMAGFARHSDLIAERPLAGPVPSASQAINKRVAASGRVKASGGI